MLLDPLDVCVFYHLHAELLMFVNRRLRALPDILSIQEEFYDLPISDRRVLIQAWLANLDLTDVFIEENPADLIKEELDIVRGWRHPLMDRFYVLRDRKPRTIFLQLSDPAIAYGVIGLAHSFEQLIGPHFPVLIRTVLLPYRGEIIYDGVLDIGDEIDTEFLRVIRNTCDLAIRKYGIITSLPSGAASWK